MAKDGFFTRLFGTRTNKQNKPTIIKKSIPRIEISSRSTSSKSLTAVIPNKPTQPIHVLQPVDDSSSNLFFSDVKDKVTNMNEFIQTKENNQTELFLLSRSQLTDGASYNNEQHQHDEFLTLTSSSTSSSLSLQDALFSNLDTRSEITTFSSQSYKIQSPSTIRSSCESIFDRRFSIADTISSQPIVVTQESDALYFETELCNLYVDGLRALSSHDPIKAFRLFESVSIQGHQFYQELNTRTRTLVNFALYRAGRTLYESQDSTQRRKEEGLGYLRTSSRNGNARATFILGFYAEQKNDFESACQYYHRAALDGDLLAKVSFGVLVLFKNISSFKTNEAIQMLDFASQKGHSIASLSLALYYEKIDRLDLSIKYCKEVNILKTSPIFCVSSYQLGVIYLKAGPNFASKAFGHILDAAEATYDYTENQVQFTTPLRKLGVLYLKGIGTSRNHVAAFRYIFEAARLGDEPANIILAQLYANGQGVETNLSAAMRIYHNYDDNIAATLSRGLIMMNTNPTKAYREFQRVVRHKTTAFDEEHWDVDSIKNEARVRIAVWEYNGIGSAEKNPARAFRTLKKLSDESNYSGAHYWLAWAYMEGVKLEDGTVIVPIDKDQAFAYFLKGALKDVHECQYRVGLMLREGFQHPKYKAKDALAFFYEAARKENVDALTMVGVYYFTGSLGTENGRDYEKAFGFFSAAAKQNDPIAIRYLADYIITNRSSHSIDHRHVFTELNRQAGTHKNPSSFRMLALVADKSIDPREFYETTRSDQLDNYMLRLYSQAKQESIQTQTELKFRFTLHCLWQAIKLNDHQSGHLLCTFIPKMSEDDISKSIDIFGQKEISVASKMTMSFAEFLKETGDKPSSLKLYLKVASSQEVTTRTAWSARIESAKLILNEGQGKATSKSLIFRWLNEMLSYPNGTNLFMPYILLGKCHEKEICDGCDKQAATKYYEYGLQCKSDDLSLEIYARMRLVETYYKSNRYPQLIEQSKIVEDLIHSIHDVSKTKSILADIYYYKGLLILHSSSEFNYLNKAIRCLSKSGEYGNILAYLELGYMYGTIEGKEDLAEECFQMVENSKKTSISFKNRLTEAMVAVRTQQIKSPEAYALEIKKMKIAAGITYSYYNMERQALDWFKEISDHPISQIMTLYYEMKDISKRTPQNIQHLTRLIDPFEKAIAPNTYEGTAVSYGEFRLGQCYQHGHGVAINNNLAYDLYSKACAFLQNNETYERLVEIKDLIGSEIDLFTDLYNAARNDTEAMFKMGQYHHQPDPLNQDNDIPHKKAADYYHKAAQVGHAESCYYYAKYLLAETRKDATVHAAVRSKRASNYLRVAADQNHAPSFYELGKLELEVGYYDEGLEDLKEAAFLKHGMAAYELGELHRNGFIGYISGEVTFRVPASINDAKSWYEEAYTYGCTLALIRLGSIYETGLTEPQNLSKARDCYVRAYNSQTCYGGVAEYALGCLEETCLSVSSSLPTNAQRKAAFDWFQKALEAKNQMANFKIGTYLLRGWVIQTTPERDQKRGLEILNQEKEEGNVLAIKELARHFEQKGNSQKAFECYITAGHLDDPDALEYIALCYDKGLLGLKVDPQEASKYRALASEARNQAVETQRSMMGFRSDYSEERNRSN